MENQVQRLLQSEKEVNRQVQAALENKRKKLSTIQGEAEIAVKQFKEELEAQMTATVAQVSIAVFKIFNTIKIDSLFAYSIFSVETSTHARAKWYRHIRC